MKAQKNTNAEAIKQYLLLSPRTRKEIVKFVACDLNGMDSFSFDEQYKGSLRGYYSTFFRDVQYNGNIAKDGNKYYVTKACQEEKNGLWSMNKDRKIEILTNRAKNMSNQWQEIRHLKRENEIKLNEIHRLNKVRRSLELELDEVTAEKHSMEESLLMYSGRAKRYAKKLEVSQEKSNDNEIIIKINLDITK